MNSKLTNNSSLNSEEIPPEMGEGSGSFLPVTPELPEHHPLGDQGGMMSVEPGDAHIPLPLEDLEGLSPAILADEAPEPLPLEDLVMDLPMALGDSPEPPPPVDLEPYVPVVMEEPSEPATLEDLDASMPVEPAEAPEPLPLEYLGVFLPDVLVQESEPLPLEDLAAIASETSSEKATETDELDFSEGEHGQRKNEKKGSRSQKRSTPKRGGSKG